MRKKFVRKTTGNTKSMFGKMTDFQVWDKFLGPDVLVSWVDCKTSIEGNLIAWSTTQWNLTGLLEEEVRLSVN